MSTVFTLQCENCLFEFEVELDDTYEDPTYFFSHKCPSCGSCLEHPVIKQDLAASPAKINTHRVFLAWEETAPGVFEGRGALRDQPIFARVWLSIGFGPIQWVGELQMDGETTVLPPTRTLALAQQQAAPEYISDFWTTAEQASNSDLFDNAADSLLNAKARLAELRDHLSKDHLNSYYVHSLLSEIESSVYEAHRTVKVLEESDSNT